MARHYRYIEIPLRDLPIPNDDVLVSGNVALSVGLVFDQDASLIGRCVTELIVTIDDVCDNTTKSIRIPIDFAEDLVSALQAASHRAAEMHIPTPPEDETDDGWRAA